METNDVLWQAKLLAWIHDPAEKALILLRDPEGHEGGTVASLKERLFPGGIPNALQEIVKRADQWAAAADRPQFPRKGDRGPFEAWTQVRFEKAPVLFHPLSGDKLDMGDFEDINPAHLKAVSFDHFKELVVTSEDGMDFQRTLLSFWRFGPDKPAKELGALWSLLPADTRVPDHTIWAHLDLVSAFSGAFVSDPSKTAALLVVSIGPVQGFIAQARTTSDLWAGSHLLSMISWEAMKVVCERFGPDSVIFPQLRGVPIVDLWLSQEMRLSFEKSEVPPQWKARASDANPLFSAALPNKFVAVVSSAHVEKLAERIKTRVRQWIRERGHEAIRTLLAEAKEQNRGDFPCYSQVERQLAEFPEIFWAAVPWSLISEKDGVVDKTDELAEAMRAFYPKGIEAPGFLGTRLWKLLSTIRDSTVKSFFEPNPGVLYPAVYDLVDRLLGAAKSVRPFEQVPQVGFRCSLCGEREWLCLDLTELQLSPGKRNSTLWTKIGEIRPAWARKGEHLCAICTLKRLWPSMFAQEVGNSLSFRVGRYVVSTHTMALATTLDRWLSSVKEKGLGEKSPLFTRISNHVNRPDIEKAALPRSLHMKVEELPDEMREIRDFAYRLPAFLDDLREKAQELTDDGKADGEKQLREIEQSLENLFEKRPEAYYGLIFMDGDHMGKWVSGDPSIGIENKRVWHPHIVSNLEDRVKDPELYEYIKDFRPMSPARHMAISAALNAFSLNLSRYVVEDIFKGKLLYSGGDDLLAMVSVDDLLPAMFLLRMVYRGIGLHNKKEVDVPWQWLGLSEPNRLRAAKGHVQLGKRLYRVMGSKATASFGAVVAHHTAPLGSVLRELRKAEKRAKNEGGRDAFSITLMKRAGARVHLTLPWLIDGPAGADMTKTPMGALISMRNALADKDVSRRAAYIIQDWILKLPSAEMVGQETFKDMLAKNMEYQLRRQCKGSSRYAFLGSDLAEVALKVNARSGKKDEREFIHAFLAVAEFFAREGRLELQEERRTDD